MNNKLLTLRFIYYKIVMKSKEGELIEVKYKNANKYFLEGYEIV